MPKTVNDYRALPFNRTVRTTDEEDGSYYVAFVEELPWIRVYGDTREEVRYLLDQSFDDAIQTMLDAGDEIPEPVGAPAKWKPARKGKGLSKKRRPLFRFSRERQKFQVLTDVTAETRTDFSEQDPFTTVPDRGQAVPT